MDKNSNSFTLVFAVAVCVALATALAATFNGLKSTIDANKLFDKNKNVMIAVGLFDAEKDADKTQAELEKRFNDKVKIQVLKFIKGDVKQDYKEGGKEKTRTVRQVVRVEATAHKIEELPALERQLKADKKENEYVYGPLYVAETATGKAYCIPISGYGLWSTLYGFLALEGDLRTVRGITFYQHGETPGLGGEVEKEWWRKDWKGKTTLEGSRLVGVTVLRGRGNPDRGSHEVDGISGATITCKGVTKFILEDLQKYEPYFKTIRS